MRATSLFVIEGDLQMAVSSSFSNFHAAMALMYHVCLNPVTRDRGPVRCGVPDHLDNGPLPAAGMGAPKGDSGGEAECAVTIKLPSQ